MIRGCDVLYALRDLEREQETDEVWARDVGQTLGRKDGRAVTGKLIRLEQAGLVHRVGHVDPIWRTTQRGREVERLLTAADAGRGGTFRPRHDVISDLNERLALAL